MPLLNGNHSYTATTIILQAGGLASLTAGATFPFYARFFDSLTSASEIISVTGTTSAESIDVIRAPTPTNATVRNWFDSDNIEQFAFNSTTGSSSGSGASGISGTNGQSGISGDSNGSSGLSGQSGKSGISGNASSGISGSDGVSGQSGISGNATSGLSGQSGISGDSNGMSGISGQNGNSGLSGRSGISGNASSGISGLESISGISGNAGSNGTSGISGNASSGISGNAGVSGYGVGSFTLDAILISPTGTTTVVGWFADRSCTLTHVAGYVTTDVGSTITTRKNGVSFNIVPPFTLSAADTWLNAPSPSAGTTSFVLGDKLEFIYASVSGGPSQIGIQTNFSVP